MKTPTATPKMPSMLTRVGFVYWPMIVPMRTTAVAMTSLRESAAVALRTVESIFFPTE